MVKTNWKDIMRKEVVLDYFKVLHMISGGGIEENHKIFQSVLSVRGLDSNRSPCILVRGVAL
jgi:hypothetical protein